MELSEYIETTALLLVIILTIVNMFLNIANKTTLSIIVILFAISLIGKNFEREKNETN